MDFTQIPTELIYKERLDLNEFGVCLAHSFNGQIYYFLREELYETFGFKKYHQLVLWILNEAYCLTTVILYDKDSDENMRNYIRHDFIHYIYYRKEFKKYYNFCQDVVYGLVYIFLEGPALKNPTVKSARIQLREYADNYKNLKTLVEEDKLPKEDAFAPIELDRSLLKTIEWENVTNEFDESYVHYFIESLGNNNNETLVSIKFR